MTKYQLIIVDDHPLFRDALRHVLNDFLANATISEAGSMDELSEIIDQVSEINLVLLDLATPWAKGFLGLMSLRAHHPEVPVMVVSATENHEVMRRCLEFGAAGFIPKSASADTIREAVKQVLEGGVWSPPNFDLADPGADELAGLITSLSTLTPQQVRVLAMVSKGLLNKQIAYQLGISEATVKAHVSAILQKLGVDSRTQAVIAVNKIESLEWQKAAP